MITLVALCWCSHCGVARRLRREGECASCASCGKVLLQLRGDAAAAEGEPATRPRRKARMRRRRSKAHRAAAEPADGGGAGAGAGEISMREASDAESNTG